MTGPKISAPYLSAVSLLFLAENYLQYQLMFHMDCFGNTHDSLVMTFCGLSFIFCFLMLACLILNIYISVKKRSGHPRAIALLTQSCIILNGVYAIIFLYVMKEWSNFI